MDYEDRFLIIDLLREQQDELTDYYMDMQEKEEEDESK